MRHVVVQFGWVLIVRMNARRRFSIQLAMIRVHALASLHTLVLGLVWDGNGSCRVQDFVRNVLSEHSVVYREASAGQVARHLPLITLLSLHDASLVALVKVLRIFKSHNVYSYVLDVGAATLVYRGASMRASRAQVCALVLAILNNFSLICFVLLGAASAKEALEERLLGNAIG